MIAIGTLAPSAHAPWALRPATAGEVAALVREYGTASRRAAGRENRFAEEARDIAQTLADDGHQIATCDACDAISAVDEVAAAAFRREHERCTE